MDTVQLLKVVRGQVRHMLDHPYRFSWSFQGLGMYRVKLTEDVRVHIWMPSEANEGVSDMHTHPWSFRSLVLAGSIRDIVYQDVGRVEDGLPARRHEVICGPDGGGALDDGKMTGLRPLSDQVHEAGTSYKLPWNLVHRSRPQVEGTVTVLLKTEKVSDDQACVYRWPHDPFGTAEAAPPTRDDIIRAAWTARQLWNARYGGGA